jgi:hypothetical protein
MCLSEGARAALPRPAALLIPYFPPNLLVPLGVSHSPTAMAPITAGSLLPQSRAIVRSGALPVYPSALPTALPRCRITVKLSALWAAGRQTGRTAVFCSNAANKAVQRRLVVPGAAAVEVPAANSDAYGVFTLNYETDVRGDGDRPHAACVPLHCFFAQPGAQLD